jgi:hypothetical protein
MPSDSLLTESALVCTAAELDPELLARYTGAETIDTTERKQEHGGGWLHWLHFKDKKRSYDELNEALVAIEIHKKARCFLALLDDGGCTGGKIILNPSSFDPDASVKRSWPPGPSDLLIPGMERLSKELKIDFAVNVHNVDGKRRRGQVKTIYDDSAEATSQTKAATNIKQSPSKKTKPTPKPQQHDMFAEKALDTISQSHKETLQAKEETINALTNALFIKDELVRTQAALINALQKC